MLELISIHNRNWGLIASIMQGRTGKQIRERYLNKLNPEINNLEWTEAEDLKILELYNEIGSKWTEISKAL